MIALWGAGNNMDASLALLGDLRVVGTAWSTAAAGWILAELAPVVVLVVLEAVTQTRAARLRAAREKLVAEWEFEGEPLKPLPRATRERRPASAGRCATGDENGGRATACPRHADEGRHPRLAFVRAAQSWMPTFVGMTGVAAGVFIAG